jgi:flagellar biosynthetic protein FliQ
MTVPQAIDTVREAFSLMLLISLPILAAALVVGLFVSVLQAVTQIQEQTLSFVPKIIGMGIVAMMAIPWIVVRIMEFASRMFGTL